MKYIFVIICSIILPVFSLKEITSKFCINCKFFTNNIITRNEFGKCSLFPIVEKNDEFLVTGNKKVDYTYCSIARKYDDMCGKEGKKYKNKLSKNDDLK